MVLPSRLAGAVRSARTWVGLGVLAPLGMLAVSGLMLLDLRRDAWDKAAVTSKNLLQVVERDIARNVEIIDLSLRAAVENLRAPGVAEATPEMRQLILFDRAASARDLGVLLILDENGEIVADAGALPHRRGNNADREYFKVHAERAGLGLHVGRPVVSRLTGERMLNFSRRIDKPDGSFGGVVVGTIKLAYFSDLFERIGLGREGGINLYRMDGTRIMRHPFVEADIGANIASAPTFERFAREGSGTFVDTSVRDGVRRLYTFTRVGDLPLILNVALAVEDIEAEWRAKAMIIGSVLLVLCGLTIALSLLFGRELRRRALMQDEMTLLARTDALTGLANRRRFQQAYAQACEEAGRTNRPLSLLVVDADHFKRYNDCYGHAVGDAILQGLASRLTASVHRPEDLVARVGGEEFVLLLPDTDAAGTLRVAAKVHAEVSTLAIDSAGIGPGAVTVSIGAAMGIAEGTDLYLRADAALYEAKRRGRNQTRVAPSPADGPALRLVGT